MKKLFYLLLIAVTSLSFQSCKDDDADDAAWRNQNEATFTQYSTKPDYDSIGIDGLQGFIYRNILKSATTPGDTAIIGSKATVRYTGKLINGTIFDTREKATFTVGPLIKGWLIALQQMTPGDKWEIVVPWTLGYGQEGYKPSIAPYSTLIFDIELISVDKYPK